MILQSVGVLSGAKVFGAVYAGLGLIFGFIFSLVSIFSSMIPMGTNDFGNSAPFFGLLFGVGAIIFLPIFYGVMGFIVGAIGALIYNLISGVVGGLELVLVDKPGGGALGMSQPPPAMG